MDMFVGKEGGGRGCFDSLLEEKGGWIFGDAPKHDEEMVDAVIVEASQCKSKEGLNPFRVQCGEILPLNVEGNFNGFFG